MTWLLLVVFLFYFHSLRASDFFLYLLWNDHCITNIQIYLHYISRGYTIQCKEYFKDKTFRERPREEVFDAKHSVHSIERTRLGAQSECTHRIRPQQLLQTTQTKKISSKDQGVVTTTKKQLFRRSYSQIMSMLLLLLTLTPSLTQALGKYKQLADSIGNSLDPSGDHQHLLNTQNSYRSER